MSLREQLIVAVLFRDRFGHEVVGVDKRVASRFFFDAFNKDASFLEAHVLGRVGAVEIESYQVVRLRLNGFQKEVGLFDRIAGLAEMISAPFVTALLRFNLALGVFMIDTIANCRAMNDRNRALVSRKLVPIDRITFKRIDGERDVGTLPGFVEFEGLGEGE